ncbi:hypothetical protein G5714_004168 [Onychostoma macrolepis]|uniref:3',5'-cyclic-GMP phosphodiesterase n=1 Tax=Onychostoma macrolepis TaxID=369639 RepID=A0A7J6DBU1_9TELE|nr:hypothetical protein G5714_004168 [Onychostoma macrolepis]
MILCDQAKTACYSRSGPLYCVYHVYRGLVMIFLVWRVSAQVSHGDTHTHTHTHTLSLCVQCLMPVSFLVTDITVVCPWEAFGDMELSDLAKYGII